MSYITEFASEMVAISGLIVLITLWSQKKYAQGVDWFCLALAMSVTIRMCRESTLVDAFGMCCVIYGGILICGCLLKLTWIPGVTVSVPVTLGRFCLAAAFGTGIVGAHDLYVTHHATAVWGENFFSLFVLGSTLMLFLPGLGFLWIGQGSPEKSASTTN